MQQLGYAFFAELNRKPLLSAIRITSALRPTEVHHSAGIAAPIQNHYSAVVV